MKKNITSFTSFIFKFVVPVLFILGFTGEAISIILSRSGHEITDLIIIFIVGILFIYLICIKLKEVSIDEEYLYISNYSKEIKVHRSNIEKVTENVFIQLNPVWIHFKEPTEFGNFILFIPKLRSFKFLSTHPIVNELREKIEKI